MSGRLDFTKGRDRDRIARNGSDNIHDDGLPGGLTPPRKRPSKAALREELAEAEAKITRLVQCGCGHRATVAVPAAWIGTRSLRCTRCGERSPA